MESSSVSRAKGERSIWRVEETGHYQIWPCTHRQGRSRLTLSLSLSLCHNKNDDDDNDDNKCFSKTQAHIVPGVFRVRVTSQLFHMPSICYYTLCPRKKVSHLIFDNNFGKCGPIFKILLPGDSHENSLVYISQRFPPHLQCVATLPCESRKSKIVTQFSCWMWQLIPFHSIYFESDH